MSNNNIEPTKDADLFICLECEKVCNVDQQFENKPICISCATDSGLSQILQEGDLIQENSTHVQQYQKNEISNMMLDEQSDVNSGGHYTHELANPVINKTLFVCVECEETYDNNQQFENKPICVSCASNSGLSQVLHEERQGHENEKIVETGSTDSHDNGFSGVAKEISADSSVLNVNNDSVQEEAVQGFICIECEENYPVNQQFENKPICIPCAKNSGLAQILQNERDNQKTAKNFVVDKTDSDINESLDELDKVMDDYEENNRIEPEIKVENLAESEIQDRRVITTDVAVEEQAHLTVDLNESHSHKKIESFDCLECDKKYTLDQQFEGKSICISCATAQDKVAEISGSLAVDNNETIEALEETVIKETVITPEKEEDSVLNVLVDQSSISVKQNNKSGENVVSDKQIKHDDLKITEEDWVALPTGKFLMGSPTEEVGREADDEYLHRLDITAFEIMSKSVTFAQYDLFCKMTGRKEIKDKEGWGRNNRPVIFVSYWDAIDYAQWLSEQTGWDCRLPTEAEWEYACRAETQTPFNVGNNISSAQANYNGVYPYNKGKTSKSRASTLPVGTLSANKWGLYNMHGNVWEWCASEYDSDYGDLEQMDASLDADREDENIADRCLRGGSWNSKPIAIRSATRFHANPDKRSREWGFRLVRSA